MKKFLLVLFVFAVLVGTTSAENYGMVIQGSSPGDWLFPEGQGLPPTYWFINQIWSYTSGDFRGYMNEFWNDCVVYYDCCRNQGIPEENIWVLWGNGSQWGMEQTNYPERYKIPFVDMDASRASLDSICNYLEGVLTEEDVLWVFTFDHGGPNALCLYGSSITYPEFAQLFDAIPYKYRIFWMQQCFSGSAIDDLANTSTILMTSTDDNHSAWRADDVEAPGDTVVPGIENEIYEITYYMTRHGDIVCFHGEFDFHWITALLGGWKLSGDTTQCLIDLIDTNQDDKISMTEQFAWVLARDTRYYHGLEFPQLSDKGGFTDRCFIWPKMYIEPPSAVPETPTAKGFALKVYPNPARTFVNFAIQNPAGKAQLRIFDSSGRLVKQCQITDRVNLKLDIAGVYFYKLFVAGENTESGKFVMIK